MKSSGSLKEARCSCTRLSCRQLQSGGREHLRLATDPGLLPDPVSRALRVQETRSLVSPALPQEGMNNKTTPLQQHPRTHPWAFRETHQAPDPAGPKRNLCGSSQPWRRRAGLGSVSPLCGVSFWQERDSQMRIPQASVRSCGRLGETDTRRRDARETRPTS